MRQIHLIGNLGINCTEKVVKDKRVIHFSLCVNEKFKMQDGTLKETAYWFDCSLWVMASKTTDYSKIFIKGGKFYVRGIPSVYTYLKGNETIAGISVNIQEFEIISLPKPEEDTNNGTN